MNEQNTWANIIGSDSVRIAATGVLGILALFLLVETIHGVENLGRPDTPVMNTITVDGEGSAVVIPDIATISFSVTETAKAVADAQAAATRRTNAALVFLEGQGIAEKDVKTTNYSISPHYDYIACSPYGICPPTNQRISGYDVTQSVEIKVRDTDTVGVILQGLGDAGVQNVYGPNFSVDDPDKAKSEAREEAIAKAKAKAGELAQALGVRLVRVSSFWENSGGPIYYATGMGGAEKAGIPAPSVPTGENEITIQVSITYEIR